LGGVSGCWRFGIFVFGQLGLTKTLKFVVFHVKLGARESGGDDGLLLFGSSHVPFWLFSLALLATVRGGTSFLFPTAKKK
jgi:hypothetical protein